MAEIQAVSAPTAEYLEAIDRSLWAKSFATVTKFGHNTSNIVESVNNALGPYRQMPPLQLLNGIYHWAMTLIYNRAQKKQQTEGN